MSRHWEWLELKLKLKHKWDSAETDVNAITMMMLSDDGREFAELKAEVPKLQQTILAQRALIQLFKCALTLFLSENLECRLLEAAIVTAALIRWLACTTRFNFLSVRSQQSQLDRCYNWTATSQYIFLIFLSIVDFLGVCFE